METSPRFAYGLFTFTRSMKYLDWQRGCTLFRYAAIVLSLTGLLADIFRNSTLTDTVIVLTSISYTVRRKPSILLSPIRFR